jgi:hypothetical protein
MLLALLLALLVDSTPRCAARPSVASPGGVQAYVELAPVHPSDTLVTATVCIVSRSAKIGSYHGELLYDSLTARFVRAETPTAAGMHAENSRESGRLRFAGAAPTGFPEPALLSVTLRVRKAGTRPAVRLDVRELNATDGASLLQQLVPVSSP